MSKDFRVIAIAMLLTYLSLTIFIGWFVRKKRVDANDWLNASRSLPIWIVSLAFLSANCGALEVVGLSALAAQYGVQAFHFYWIGAIPAIIFLSLWMLPAYIKSGIRTVPEYLQERYDHRVRRLNACMVALTVLMLSGIDLYAIGQVLHVVIGLSFALGVLLLALVVLTYLLLGGVRATIYNEIFQLVVLIGGLLPLAFRTFRFVKTGGSTNSLSTHLWTSLPLASTRSPLDVVGVVFGLGFILSFSYWATDFVLMQRALATRSDLDARKVPIWAGFGKLGISFLVVFPGIAAARFLPGLGVTMRFDETLPAMMTIFYGPTLLAIGLTALTASLMSGLAANVAAFAAIWTQDIYRPWLHPGADETHYLRVGTIATVAAMVIGCLASGASFYFGNLMEHVQLIFSLFGAPFWAIFLLGITTRRVNARGALAGFLCGASAALIHHALLFCGILHYGSIMNADFHAAIYGFLTSLIVAWVTSGTTISYDPNVSLTFAPAIRFDWKAECLLLVLAGLLLLTCICLNVLWR